MINDTKSLVSDTLTGVKCFDHIKNENLRMKATERIVVKTYDVT